LKNIGVLSCGKVLGILYALLGLLIGLSIALVSLIGAVASTGSPQSGSDGLIFGTLFGVGTVIFLPISYGIIGFVGGLISALLYNLIARLVGGIELEIEQRGERGYYNGSHCSWATSVTPTLERDTECIGTPATSVLSRARLGGPMSLHAVIETWRGR